MSRPWNNPGLFSHLRTFSPPLLPFGFLERKPNLKCILGLIDGWYAICQDSLDRILLFFIPNCNKMFSVTALCRHSPKPTSSMSSDWFEHNILIQVGPSKFTSTFTGAGVYKRTLRCGGLPVCALSFNCWEWFANWPYWYKVLSGLFHVHSTCFNVSKETWYLVKFSIQL